MDELPGAMLRWIEASVGDGSRVVSVRAMERASADMHEVAVEAGDGTPHRLVLRRYADGPRLGTDPFYDSANEAFALRLLEETDVPAPRLVAIAYGFIWVMLFGYLWSVRTRLARVEREMESLSRRAGATRH